MPQDDLPDPLLASLVARHLDVDPQGLRVRRCPTGKFNETYFVEGGPAPLVLRIAPPEDRSRVLFYEHRMMRQEPALHALLRETDRRARARHPGPRLQPCGDRPGLPADGTAPRHADLRPSGPDPSRLEDLLREVGRCLRQVHAITGDRYGYVGEHRPMEPQGDWASAFAVMWHKLLDDIERCGGYSEEEATGMRRLLDRHSGPSTARSPPRCCTWTSGRRTSWPMTGAG